MVTRDQMEHMYVGTIAQLQIALKLTTLDAVDISEVTTVQHMKRLHEIATMMAFIISSIEMIIMMDIVMIMVGKNRDVDFKKA
ncbi:MAG: hypothetical protein CME62_14115 [Halobacteriovoraceae bacterium]|nr:hypothetical protein [Halobacteriovoraceae bacterium]